MTNTTNRPACLDIAQTDDYREAFRAIYTDADMMKAWLTSDVETGLCGKLRRAVGCLRIARDPRFRYGLEASDTAAVVPMCEAVIAAISAELETLRSELLAPRLEGLTWGEAFNYVTDDHGFDGSTVGLLGVAHYDMCPKLRARLAAG